MDRIIKFRVWIKAEQKLYSCADNDNFAAITGDGQQVGSGDSCSGWINVPDQAILMQFTGFIDRYGVDIYEGDIIQGTYDFSPYTKKVTELEVVKTDKGQLLPFYELFSPDLFWIDEMSEIKLIGNIYEHPDLLETKEGIDETH